MWIKFADALINTANFDYFDKCGMTIHANVVNNTDVDFAIKESFLTEQERDARFDQLCFLLAGYRKDDACIVCGVPKHD